MKRPLITLLTATLLTVSYSLAATLGPSLTTAAFDGGGGTVSWVNPGNATATDGVFATMTGSSTATVYNEFAFNQFTSWNGTNIPSTATINGVQIDIKGLQSASATWKDTNLQFVGAASGISSNLATNSASTYTTSNAVHTYGGSSNLIGGTWTPADFNSTATLYFDIAKAAGSTSQSFSVDSVQITVTYTPLAASTTRTWTAMAGVGHGGTDAGYIQTPALSGFQTQWEAWWFNQIPGGATYTNAHAPSDPGTTGFYAANFSIDNNYEISAHNSDGTANLVQVTDWGHRVCSSGCTTLQTGLHLPSTFYSGTYSDLVDPNGGVNTPNNPTIYWNLDTGLVYYINAACRVTTNGNLYGYQSATGTHGGSQTRGGYVTLAELNAGVINHAIAIEVYAHKYLSSAGSGFTSPALQPDGYYNDAMGSPTQYYAGSDSTMVMGSRFAPPAASTAVSLSISNADAITIFNAAKKYGMYIVDDTSWDDLQINASPDADTRINAASADIIKIFNAAQHVQ